jgi:hypothetical protein
VVRLLLANRRVDPSDERRSALECASGSGHIDVVATLLTHPKSVVTREAPLAADIRDHKSVVDMLFEKDPGVVFQLFWGQIACKPNGVLRCELRRREQRSAQTLLFSMERRR